MKISPSISTRVRGRIKMMPLILILVSSLLCVLIWSIRRSGRNDAAVDGGSGTGLARAVKNQSFSGSSADRERSKREKDRIRLISEAQLKANENELAALAAKPSFETIGPTGQLTAAAVETLNLSDVEEKSVKEVIGRMSDLATDDFSSRMTLINSNEQHSTFSYFVKARPDRGKELIDSLSRETADILGEERSKKFMSGLGAYSFSAGFGKYDVELNLSTKNGNTEVIYRIMSPKTGSVFMEGVSNMAEFNRKFGNVFEEK